MRLTPSLRRLVALATLTLIGGEPCRASVRVEMLDGGSPLPGQAVPGATVTLRVKAIGQTANPEWQVAYGDTDLTRARYQWYHGGALLPGATGQTLVLPNLSAADAGTYSVQVASRAPASDVGFIAVNVAPAPTASFVDSGFAVPTPPTSPFSYLDQTQASHIAAILADGSVVVNGYAIGDMMGWKVLGPDGRMITGWYYDVIHYSVSTRIWPDGTIITTRTNGSASPETQVWRIDRATPFPLPEGFTYSGVGAELVDGPDMLIAQGSRLVRLNAARELDAGFTAELPDSTASIVSIVSDGAGRYLVTVLDDQNQARFLRLRHDGAADPAFAPFLLTDYKGRPGAPVDAAWVGPFAQTDGGVLWAVPDAAAQATAIVRLRSDGRRDDTFQVALPGIGTTTIDTQGRVYLARQGRLLRYLTAGGNAEVDPGFYPGTPNGMLYGFALDARGGIIVYGGFTAWNDHTTYQVARLLPDVATAPALPAVWLETQVVPDGSWTYPRPKDRITVAPSVLGTGPFTYEWINVDGGSLPSDAQGRTLVFDSFSEQNFGRYQVRVTSPAGVTLSEVLDLSVTSLPQVGLTNLSGAAVVGTGENLLIAGFVQESTLHPRPFVLRGVGPGLTQFGVAPVATDPELTLFDGAGAVVSKNDNWTEDTASGIAQVGAFPFAQGSKDAVIWTQCHGLYSLQVTDRDARNGRGLVEIYDAYPIDFYYGRLVNLSLRAHVGTGDDVAIAGFVVRDPSGFGRAAKMLVRAIGPTLAGQGVEHPLADPVLSLINAAGTVIARNNDWGQVGDLAALAAASRQVGAFTLPTGSKDAAMLVQVPAGSYTVHAAGADGGTGVALVEVYLVP